MALLANMGTLTGTELAMPTGPRADMSRKELSVETEREGGRGEREGGKGGERERQREGERERERERNEKRD